MKVKLTDQLVDFFMFFPIRLEALLTAEEGSLDAQLDARGTMETGLLATVRTYTKSSH